MIDDLSQETKIKYLTPIQRIADEIGFTLPEDIDAAFEKALLEHINDVIYQKDVISAQQQATANVSPVIAEIKDRQDALNAKIDTVNP